MPGRFWEAIRSFQIEKAEINDRQSKHCSDMHDTVIATQTVIVDSRALIREAEEIMARDLLQPKLHWKNK